MALSGNPQPGRLIHHSYRGSQYCCADYVGILEKRYIKISMTQTGDPLENALAERVNGILKDELLEKQYQNFEQAQQAIAIAISTYNHHRPHSSIDMLTPVEAHMREGELKRRWKNYYSPKKQKEPCKRAKISPSHHSSTRQLLGKLVFIFYEHRGIHAFSQHLCNTVSSKYV